VLEKFNAELVSVCPDFPLIELDKYGDHCLEYEINYATAMASAEKKALMRAIAGRHRSGAHAQPCVGWSR